MQFLDPDWLPFVLLPLLLAVGVVIARRRQQGAWRAFVSAPNLVSKLVRRADSIPGWISVILVVIACVLTIISLAMPTNGRETIELPTVGRKIYIAVDLSRSMLVKDVSPDRLTVAKTAALEVIEAFPDEKIGLISFAGRAWLEAPLTTDHTALREAVLQMNEDTIPFGGSNTTSLLELITKSQEEEEVSEALLLILSDGEFHSTPSAGQINKATDAGLSIYTLGFGTAKGDYVPDKRRRDGLFRDRSGRPVVSTLQTESLSKIASLGNGQYFAADDYSFIPRLRAALGVMNGEEQSSRDLVIHRHIYYYFLIPAMLALLGALLIPTLWSLMKPQAAVLALLGFVLPLQHVEANQLVSTNDPAGALSSQIDKQATYEQDAKRFQQIALEAKGENIPRARYSQGVAEYRSKNFAGAVQSFSDSLLSDKPKLQKEAHYNLGNSLYNYGAECLSYIPDIKKPEDQIKMRGAVIKQWEDCLDHYSATLHLDPAHPTAKDNYDYVKSQLEKEQETQKQQCQQQGESGEPNEDSQEGDDCENPGGGSRGSGDGLTPEEIQELMDDAKDKGDEPKPREEEGGKQKAPEIDDSALEKDRRPGETEEEHAQRLLEESSDAEKGNMRTGREKFQSGPSKDW